MTILEFTGLMSLAIQVIGITFKLILFIETHIKENDRRFFSTSISCRFI